MPLNEGYCTPSDLDLSRVIMDDPEETQRFVLQATEEMDSKLGWLYIVPLPMSTMKYHERLLIKTICRKIATGRMILTYAVPDEGGSNHSYGLRLIQEGLDELHMIANGDITLSVARGDQEGSPLDPDAGGVGATHARLPEMFHQDSESLLNGFTKTVHGGIPWYVVPDDNVVEVPVVSPEVP